MLLSMEVLFIACVVILSAGHRPNLTQSDRNLHDLELQLGARGFALLTVERYERFRQRLIC